MVSLGVKGWVALNLLHAKIFSVSDFLDEKLEMKGANSNSMEIDGLVVLDFALGDDGKTLSVPFVVTAQTLIEPVLGYTVIEHLVLDGDADQRTLRVETFVILKMYPLLAKVNPAFGPFPPFPLPSLLPSLDLFSSQLILCFRLFDVFVYLTFSST